MIFKKPLERSISIISSRNLGTAHLTLEACSKHTIQLITFQSPLYPSRLQRYATSPTLLYVKGSIEALNAPLTASVIGARRCNHYGKEATIQLVTSLAQNHIPIISGMAKGIDSHAHTAVLHANGYTVAVVGTGLDRCYPIEHQGLMEEIAKKGAVISQFPPLCEVHKQYFIRRNELIAMLSDYIYIMQASKTSGSLYTAECGLRLNKEVFTLPGSIYDPLQEGNHLLLTKGAKVYILSSHLPMQPPAPPKIHMSSNTKKLLKLLTIQPLPLEILQEQLHIPLSNLEEIILSLELQDTIYQNGGLIHLSSH
ncbi:MAG: DNA-processing protein DprA [Cellulosilyticaceae bacterium]